MASNDAAMKRAPAPILIVAAAFAVGELLAGIAIGGFFHGLRAEPMLFIAFRPWLLLAAAAWVSADPLRARAFFYALSLLTAATSETLFLLMLGADHVWPMTLRGLLAGALLAALLDLGLSNSRRRFGRKGMAAASLVLAGLYLSPVGLIPYDRLVLPAREHALEGERPGLMVMTNLPIIWGEKGAFDPQSRPAAAYRLLQEEFTVQPLDSLDRRLLDNGRLLLLAQPRALAPEELVAVDGWVRGGGLALILTDPALQWRTDLPLGDVRSPPPVGLLGPLLDHWGVSLEMPGGKALVAEHISTGVHQRRLLLGAPGRLEVRRGDCTLRHPWLAQCRIGKGKALILADADLLNDRMWAAALPVTRDNRLADNGLVVAELLDGLAGVDRSRERPPVDWLPLTYNADVAVLVALLPILLIVAASIVARRRRG